MNYGAKDMRVLRSAQRLHGVPIGVFSVCLPNSAPMLFPVENVCSPKFQIMRIFRPEATSNFVEILRKPMWLSLENSNASEYDVTVASVLNRSGIV